MSYEPRSFWEQRLGQHFDLRGTGEPGLSLAYNRACYDLRRRVLERALAEAGVTLKDARVLDVGSGVGFWVDFYLRHGADVTGVDLAQNAVEGLRRRFPQAAFERADVSERPFQPRFDVVNAFDVLYHVTDDARWEQAVLHLAGALKPGGVLIATDLFAEPAAGSAAHNLSRPLPRYVELLGRAGVRVERLYPTHVLLNRHLGPARFLNRAPGMLLAADRALLALGWRGDRRTNRLLLARRAAA
jgi:SAM-dependent methyltransferase